MTIEHNDDPPLGSYATHRPKKPPKFRKGKNAITFRVVSANQTQQSLFGDFEIDDDEDPVGPPAVKRDKHVLQPTVPDQELPDFLKSMLRPADLGIDDTMRPHERLQMIGTLFGRDSKEFEDSKLEIEIERDFRRMKKTKAAPTKDSRPKVDDSDDDFAGFDFEGNFDCSSVSSDCDYESRELKKLLEEFTDDKIGELDSDEDEEVREARQDVSAYDAEFGSFVPLKLNDKNEREKILTELDESEKELIKDLALRQMELDVMEDINEDENPRDSYEAPTLEYDITSVASWQTNLYNRPSRIPSAASNSTNRPLNLNEIARVPLEAFAARRRIVVRAAATALAEEEEDASTDGKVTPLYVDTTRRKGETSDERRARKVQVKDAKRQVREAKKENDLLVKDEEKKQTQRLNKNPHDIREGTRVFKIV